MLWVAFNVDVNYSCISDWHVMSIIRASLLLPSDIRCLRYMISVMMINREEPMSPRATISFANDGNTVFCEIDLCVDLCVSVTWYADFHEYIIISQIILRRIKTEQIKKRITVIRRLSYPVVFLTIAVIVILYFSKTFLLYHLGKIHFPVKPFSVHSAFYNASCWYKCNRVCGIAYKYVERPSGHFYIYWQICLTIKTNIN